jgi:quercetin dioxygenase-like cupin family protein
MEVDFDGRVAQFEAGDGLFIPAGQEHKHKGKVLTDVVRMVLVEDIQSSVGEQ